MLCEDRAANIQGFSVSGQHIGLQNQKHWFESNSSCYYGAVPQWGGGVVLKTIDLNRSESSNLSRVAWHYKPNW